MTKTVKTDAAIAQLAYALVLCDMPGEGLAGGQVVQAQPALVAALKGQGIVDDHPSAVEHALGAGAKVQRPLSELPPLDAAGASAKGHAGADSTPR